MDGRRRKNYLSLSNQELIHTFGEGGEGGPVVYGKVELVDEEMELLSLSPKYALHEQVDIGDMELELKKAGVKGR